jgi:malyl-CoA/(S)-citramalyl-CoA lyase
VRWARRVIDEMGDGAGCVMIDGKMQDDATYKQCKVMVEAGKLLARKEPDLAEAYGFSAEELA